MPIGYLVSPKDQGGDDTIDSDASQTEPYRTDIFSTTNGVPDLTRDIELYQTALANSIGDQVWIDLNQNGIQDGGSETGIVAATVNLYNVSTTLVATTMTDADGLYFFPDLAIGNYFVEFVAPTMFALTTNNVGSDDTIDSDPDPNTGFTAAISITAGQIINTVDAGMFVGLDLGVFKTVDDATPAETDTIVYTIVVTNNGPGAASGVEYTDVLPGPLLVTTMV